MNEENNIVSRRSKSESKQDDTNMTDSQNSNPNQINRIAEILFYTGIVIMVGGIIGSLFLAQTEVVGTYGTYSDFSFSLFLIYAISSVLSGIVLIGFSEIIKLLHSINIKVK